MEYAPWIPLIITSLFLWITCALYIRISEIARYLRRLEDALGSARLGWEKAFEGTQVRSGQFIYSDGFLLVSGDLLVAFGLGSTSSSLICV